MDTEIEELMRHLDRQAVAKRLKKRLETIGFRVEIQDMERPAA